MLKLEGYGPISGDFELDGYTISVKSIDKRTLRYERIGGDEHIIRTIHGATRIEILTIYPILLPSMITTYILISLRENIVVEPRGRIMIYVKMPVDNAIYVFSRLKFRIIDVFTPHRVKYILYGPTDMGRIARHVESEAYAEKPEPER
jgi:hypothetical protein